MGYRGCVCRARPGPPFGRPSPPTDPPVNRPHVPPPPPKKNKVNLPDDRVIIVSGFLDDPFRPATAKPAPSIDVFDYRQKKITVSRSKYDLGKKFFTNITPGYQLYPTVFLLPWTDTSRPGAMMIEGRRGGGPTRQRMHAVREGGLRSF